MQFIAAATKVCCECLLKVNNMVLIFLELEPTTTSVFFLGQFWGNTSNERAGGGGRFYAGRSTVPGSII